MRTVRTLRRRLPEGPLGGLPGAASSWWVRGLWALGFFVVGLSMFWVLRPVFAVLAGSAAIAYVLDPLVDWFEARGFSREMGIGFVFTALLAMAVFFFLLIVPAFVVQIQEFSVGLGPLFENLGGELKPLAAQASEATGYELDLDGTIDELVGNIGEALPQLQEIARQAWEVVLGAGQGLMTRGLDIITTLVNLALMPVFVFYLLQDWDRLVASVATLIPMDWRPRVSRVAVEVDKRLSAFVRGQITVSAAMVVLYSIGMLIVGIDLAIPVGVLSGVLFIVPYLGTIIGIALAAVLSLMKFGISLNLVLIAVVFIVVQTIEGYLLTPKIVGDQVGLHPLVVMIALIVGGSLMGIWGMLLAIPITAVLSVLGTEWLSNYFRSSAFTGHGHSSTSAEP